MLYNPKGGQQTKADLLKIETIISWLEQQPAHQTYDYHAMCGRCLFGQYFTVHGVDWVDGYFDLINIDTYLPSKIAGELPWTFGAALERAREMQRS